MHRQTSLLHVSIVCPLVLGSAGFLVLAGGLVPAEEPTASENAKATLANFIDIGEKAGLTMTNVFGGVDRGAHNGHRRRRLPAAVARCGANPHQRVVAWHDATAIPPVDTQDVEMLWWGAAAAGQAQSG